MASQDKRNLLSLWGLSTEEIEYLIKRAAFLKDRHKRGIPHKPLIGKTLGLIFEKPSTRTRVSFEAGSFQLGGSSIFISTKDSQIGRGEPIKDTARVLSRYLDGVVIRTYEQEIIEEFARYSEIPVINGLTDLLHPCQVLCDILTIIERKGDIRGLKVAWIGDGNNVANSWINASARLGFSLHLSTPKEFMPDKEILKRAREAFDGIYWTEDPFEAIEGADVINTDVWVSMGQDKEREKRLERFRGYQINDSMLKRAKKDSILLHCLPAHRGEEITDDVIEGPHSAVWDQAENRLHMGKAILEWLMG